MLGAILEPGFGARQRLECFRGQRQWRFGHGTCLQHPPGAPLLHGFHWESGGGGQRYKRQTDKKTRFFQSDKKTEPFFHEMFHAFHVVDLFDAFVLLKVRKVNDGFLGIGGKAPIAPVFVPAVTGGRRQRFDPGTSLVMTGGRMKWKHNDTWHFLNHAWRLLVREFLYSPSCCDWGVRDLRIIRWSRFAIPGEQELDGQISEWQSQCDAKKMGGGLLLLAM